VLTGRAPAGATLTLTRDAATTTWDGTSPARLRTTLVVPRSGDFTWHVNPSTRPTSSQAEKYRLTCTSARGRSQVTRVRVERGERVRVALRRC
ncbi:MAG: carboxypeptidase, partial [Actinobacteria bacterium]|nr:carboxypeptidase [Actinomycetota bacterium]